MDIARKGKGIQIQIKDREGRNSRSLTLHGISKEEVFARVHFLFEVLSKSTKGEIVIRQYNKGIKNG